MWVLAFFVLLGLGLYWFVGAVWALGTALFYIVAVVIALILGPKKRAGLPTIARLPVRGWDPLKTKYDEHGIPYLDD